MNAAGDILQSGGTYGDKLPADPKGFGIRSQLQCLVSGCPKGNSIPKA